MKKNDKIVGTCSGYTKEGLGVVKIDGFPLFVKGILQNETAEMVVTLVKKTYGYAKVLSIKEPSKQRCELKCPVAKQCGGCQLQHMTYTEQLHFKKQKVQDVIDRIAKLDMKVEDVLGMENPWYYRNKCQIPVGVDQNKVVTGFYRIHSNTIIDTNACAIQSETINEVLSHMKELLQTYGNASVFRHLLIKHAFTTGEVMLVWIVREYPFSSMKEMAKDIVQRLPYIKSVIVNVNTRTDNVILGEKEYTLYGDSYITDAIHNLKFHISSKSFYQVNPVQTNVLYGKALELAQLSGKETVIDLYCGVGTISMFLAQKAKKVIGIEIVPQAIQDAKENAKMNNIDNIEFICSDAASYANKLSEENMRPDVIVVDPPRKGLDQITLNSIIKMQPERIVYVSCDPATMARDLGIIKESNYEIKLVQPVDMFSQTNGVECVTLIERI